MPTDLRRRETVFKGSWSMRSPSLRRRALTTACLALCATSGCRPDADSAGLSEAHAAAIRDSVSSALDEFRELGSGPDPTAAGGFYSESPAFRFYESGALRYRSAADVRAALEGLGPGMRVTTEYSDTGIEALAPGVALVRSLFESTLEGEGGFAFTYGGAMTAVWIHEPDGWRILSGHTSAPVPRAGAEDGAP